VSAGRSVLYEVILQEKRMDLHPGARFDLRQIDPAKPVVSSGRQRPIRHQRSTSLPSYFVADHLESGVAAAVEAAVGGSLGFYVAHELLGMHLNKLG
jgi:hypothetical protein